MLRVKDGREDVSVSYCETAHRSARWREVGLTDREALRVARTIASDQWEERQRQLWGVKRGRCECVGRLEGEVETVWVTGADGVRGRAWCCSTCGRCFGVDTGGSAPGVWVFQLLGVRLVEPEAA
jgi:hypothetical protein